MTQDRYAESSVLLSLQIGNANLSDRSREFIQEMIAQAFRNVAADAYADAAKEALLPRRMFLTKEQISDGILDDNHPTLKIRDQMRREISWALEAKSQALREQGDKP